MTSVWDVRVPYCPDTRVRSFLVAMRWSGFQMPAGGALPARSAEEAKRAGREATGEWSGLSQLSSAERSEARDRRRFSAC